MTLLAAIEVKQIENFLLLNHVKMTMSDQLRIRILLSRRLQFFKNSGNDHEDIHRDLIDI